MNHKADSTNKSDIARREEEILAFWQENDIFQKSLEKPAPKGEFTFYDGPPFATGTPHYGHILPGTIKDAIPRFKTMQGYHVERQWGWDTHGLPLENKVEEKLGLNNKKEIKEYGIDTFNEEAKDFVLQYAHKWEEIMPRTGRWVNMDDPYRTMDADYTESIWWAFNKLDEKELIYEGFKSMHICPRCETPLSNFEVNQGYHEQKDIAVTVKLPLADDPDTKLLIWTTTPWTLPGNMAVAVNKNETYVKTKVEGETLIFAKELSENVFADKEAEIMDEFAGSELVGKQYNPPFDYFKDEDVDGKENAWQVYAGDFVTLDEGTGLVHLAPAFGADDLTLAEEEGVPIVHHVKESGEFTEEVTDFAGMKVKPRDEGGEEHLSADIEILKYLASHNLLFEKENIRHQYPLCWRCDTPLLNYATSSWFVEVSKFKDELVAKNEEVGWVPEAIGSNRFGNWLEGARDWAISRERFWGAPLPVWKSEDDETVEYIDSLETLKEKTKSTNNFYLMRHGESEHNTKRIVSASSDPENGLTETGQNQAKKAAENVADVDVIYTSPLQRTKETANIIANVYGISSDKVIVDDRITENGFGELEGADLETYRNFFDSFSDRLDSAPEGGENWNEVKRRTGAFLYDINEKHNNENVLIISHNGTLEMLQCASHALNYEQSAEALEESRFDLANAEVAELSFSPLPHNDDFELDFHRPYIDDVTWKNDDGQEMSRIDAVFDCWFESGSMPYASKHYPFEDRVDPGSGEGYPAQFISEGLDQTRGWFYSMLVLGVGLFDQSPYENVIVNGLVMAEDGQKMSKSKGNYPPLSEVLDEQGADALRLFLVSSPLVRGENVAMSKDEIDEVLRKVTYRLLNTYSFVEMYTDADERKTALEAPVESGHVLDQWITTRTDELTKQVTDGLENYELDQATQPIFDFVSDLSTWYLRRSRDRIRGENPEDRQAALSTLLSVLEQTSLLLAPFMPFLAEDLYGKVTAGEKKESVHLENWPEAEDVSDKEALLSNMEDLRRAASEALDLRSQNQLKIRQPLSVFFIKVAPEFVENSEMREILKDEINVRSVELGADIEEDYELDTELTDELKEAGTTRELIREIQKLRKKAKLDPEKEIDLQVAANDEMKQLLENQKAAITIGGSVNNIEVTDLKTEANISEHGYQANIEIA